MSKNIAAALFILLLWASISPAEVLFSNSDKMSLDILANRSDFRNGTMLGIGLGMNKQLEFGFTYAFVNESGAETQMLIPGVRYYLMRPEDRGGLFFSLTGEYLLITASNGAASASGAGYILGANFGMDLKMLKGYKIMPYIGLRQNMYEISGAQNRDTMPRVGMFFGLPLGGDSIFYVKALANLFNNQWLTNASVGYQFVLNK